MSGPVEQSVRCEVCRVQVIRHYHGHLSAVYSLALHPSIDVLVTAGRDATARVWDVRTKANVHTLSGHTDTIASLACQAAEPQVPASCLCALVVAVLVECHVVKQIVRYAASGERSE